MTYLQKKHTLCNTSSKKDISGKDIKTELHWRQTLSKYAEEIYSDVPFSEGEMSHDWRVPIKNLESLSFQH